MIYKFKYLTFREIEKRVMVARINVSDLTNKDVYKKWDELENEYPPEKYMGTFIQCSHPQKEFCLT